MSTRRTYEELFTAENIRNCQEYVSSMQKRLDRAVANSDHKGIRRTFDILAKRSFAVRVLAVYNITQNKEAKTAGVDGEWIPKGTRGKDKDKMRAILLYFTHISKEPHKIKRTYINKSNGKKRPLGIPTLKDRIVQEILRIAIEPIAEYYFNDNSYGFRPKRSCHDAIKHIFSLLAKSDRKQFIVEGDIKSCFDNIRHSHITDTLKKWKVPGYAVDIIDRMLKAKIIDKDKLLTPEEGTLQGGVISPMLSNIALTSLDNFVAERFGTIQYHGGKHYVSPMIRYADDFIIACTTKQQAKQVKKEITDFLNNETGLTLSQEKTDITHITKGFNFLGFNIKKYRKTKHKKSSDYKLIIRPQRESIIELLSKCKALIKNSHVRQQDDLIRDLNAILRGWGMYYRHVVSKIAFVKIQKAISYKLYRWAKRRHNGKSWKWIMKTYYSVIGRTYRFGKQSKLFNITTIPIIRFNKVKRGARVHNSTDMNYWRKREGERAYNQLMTKWRQRLFKKQEGSCPLCNTPFTVEQISKSQ